MLVYQRCLCIINKQVVHHPFQSVNNMEPPWCSPLPRYAENSLSFSCFASSQFIETVTELHPWSLPTPPLRHSISIQASMVVNEGFKHQDLFSVIFPTPLLHSHRLRHLSSMDESKYGEEVQTVLPPLPFAATTLLFTTTMLTLLSFFP